MGSRRKQRLLLLAAANDRTFERKVRNGEVVLEGKCIHGQRKLELREDGASLNDATLEHITPKNHGGTNDVENLAIACVRCRGHDVEVARPVLETSRFTNREKSGQACERKRAVGVTARLAL